MNSSWANSTLLLLAALVPATGRQALADDQATRQYRVLVDTDLGGDPDDIQSLYRLIQYSDILKAEGIVSSPGPGSTPRADLIREWIRRVDVGRLRANGHGSLMTEAELLTLVRSGARKPGPPRRSAASEGSKRIITRAHAKSGLDNGPLWVLVWGSMTTLAQALHDDESIAPKIRVYSIGSSNTVADRESRDYVYRFMQEKRPDFWWIENGILPRRSTDTFRGVYLGGDQAGEWGNKEFIRQNIRGHGSTHDALFDRKCGDAFPVAGAPHGTLKEGDSPSMLYLLSPVLGSVGNVDDPTQESWGGQFRHFDREKFPNYYVDRFQRAADCQDTIAKWRKYFLADWKKRWDWYDD